MTIASFVFLESW